MANSDRPQGFKPQGKLLRSNVYQAGGTIYPGDAVKISNAGQVVVVESGGNIYSSAVAGVALGKGTSGGDVMVADHPDQEFAIQADESDINEQTDINLNYAIVGTSGSSTFNASRMELDSSSGATTSTLPLRLLRVKRSVGNALGAQVVCVVKINNHKLSGGTGTEGL